MTTVGQRERATQQRVVRFFIEELGYRYLGDWHTRPNNRNVEPDLLSHWLIDRGVPICSPYTQTIGQIVYRGGGSPLLTDSCTEYWGQVKRFSLCGNNLLYRTR